MPAPDPIVNGDIPDATRLMEWFNYLSGGGGIASGTYAGLKTTAAAAPTVRFLGWATDLAQLVFYTADVSIGEGGFIVIGG